MGGKGRKVTANLKPARATQQDCQRKRRGKEVMKEDKKNGGEEKEKKWGGCSGPAPPTHRPYSRKKGRRL